MGRKYKGDSSGGGRNRTLEDMAGYRIAQAVGALHNLVV